MNKKDSYCFKEGRLELSMLDESMDEENHFENMQKEKDVHQKGIQNDEEQVKQAKLQDIQGILKANDTSYIAIGKGSAQKEKEEPFAALEDIEEAELKTAAELKVSDEIYNTLKVMSEFLTQPEVSESGNTLKCDKDAEVDETTADSEQIKKDEAKKEENPDDPSKFKDYSMRNVCMGQCSIDRLLHEHFGETKPKFKFAEELRQRIEREIKKIKSYK